jgi:rod shape-determining protein MreD
VKLTSVVLVVFASVLLQVALARYTVGGRLVFDFVLVGVVCAALQWGPVAGILAGTLGGLLQDLLAGEIVGVGGLSKTIVGWAAGLIGTQFVLARPQARMVVVAAATVVHRLMMLALYGLIEQHWPAVSWTAMLAEAAINSGAALLAFQVAASLPGTVARQRMGRRSSLSRRQW